MKRYSLSNADVIDAFNQKLLIEGFTTSANIEKIVNENCNYLSNSRKRIKKYPLLLPFKANATTPTYRHKDVEAWIIDVLILLIQQGKVKEVAR